MLNIFLKPLLFFTPYILELLDLTIFAIELPLLQDELVDRVPVVDYKRMRA